MVVRYQSWCIPVGEMEIGTWSSHPSPWLAHDFLVQTLVAAKEGSNTTAIAWPIQSLSNDTCQGLFLSSDSSVWAQPLKYGDYRDKKDPEVKEFTLVITFIMAHAI